MFQTTMVTRLILLLVLLLTLVFPLSVRAEESNKFVTLVYPVRGRELWGSKSLTHLDNTFKELKDRNFKSTWLLQYDALRDKDLVSKLRNDCPKCEFGLFLEVSEDLATDSDISYKIGEGHWYRPDKIFLSGYTLREREILLRKLFDTFKDNFSNYPTSVGAWYVDPYSLNLMQEKYGVTAYVGVADQYDTDGQRYWGKPFGVPYYPQKLNSLAPANSLSNKLDIVEVQWAQRHPTDSWGSGPAFSQFSLQANDYINNKKDISYFENLANLYLNSPDNPAPQITVGLEVGQELQAFWDEHLNQLDILARKKDIKVASLSEFATWYRDTFQGVSPKSTITDGVTTWVNTPCYRAVYKNGKLFDLRSYDNSLTSPDILTPDNDFFLNREINQIDREIKKVNEIPDCKESSNTGIYNLKSSLILASEKLHQPLKILKWSNINGARVIGIQVGKEEIFGYWQGKGISSYQFPYQTLAKFNTL